MRQLLFFLVFLCYSQVSLADKGTESPETHSIIKENSGQKTDVRIVQYHYDDSGNRVGREWVVIFQRPADTLMSENPKDTLQAPSFTPDNNDTEK